MNDERLERLNYARAQLECINKIKKQLLEPEESSLRAAIFNLGLLFENIRLNIIDLQVFEEQEKEEGDQQNAVP